MTTTEAESDAKIVPADRELAPRTDAGLDDLATLSLKSCPPDVLRASQSRHRRLLVLADATAVPIALAAILGGLGLAAALIVAVAATIWLILLLKVAGLYDHEDVRLRHTTLDEAPLLLQLTGLLALAFTIAGPVLAVGYIGSERVALLWAGSFAALVCGRTLARAVARRIVEVERCLVIGDVMEADRIGRRLTSGRARAEIVACIAEGDLVNPDGAGVIPGAPGAIRDLVHELGIHRIIIAPAADSSDGAVGLIRVAKAVGVRVSIVPRILQVIGSSSAFDEVEGMSLLGVPQFGLSATSRALKRALDVVATTAAVLVLSPILLAIAIAVKLDSRGPVFFRQVRVGRGGRHFSIVKFRSMVAEAEQQKEDLRLMNVAGEGLFKVEDDPRVTRVGSFLRRSSLDELPQLFNVVRGEMSLVGPRPLVRDEDALVVGLDRCRLRLTPGMTGPWQLLGSRVSLDEMVDIDYLYASHWSLWLDVKLLLRTAAHVLRRGNM